MTINLSSYKSIQSNIFVRIQIDEYKTTSGGSYAQEILRFSDMLTPFTVEGESYHGVGRLMGITPTASELRVSGSSLTLTLSGIPSTRIFELVNSKIKGSSVTIYRVLFDATTGEYLNITGNPVGRFRGFVNNYSLDEEFDSASRTSSNTLVLTCASSVDVLNNKVSGRKTNPSSEKSFYPTDISMDRVTSLANSEFNFGAGA